MLALALSMLAWDENDVARIVSAYKPLRKHPALFDAKAGWSRWIEPRLLDALAELKAGNESVVKVQSGHRPSSAPAPHGVPGGSGRLLFQGEAGPLAPPIASRLHRRRSPHSFDHAGNESAVRSLLRVEVEGSDASVYSFAIFTTDFCDRFIEELDNYYNTP